MFRSRILLGLLAPLLVAAHVYAGGFQLNECGARAMAQAGAFAARASDASAIYFNPAGLGFQNTGSILAGVTIIRPNTYFLGPLESNTNTRTNLLPATFTPINFYATSPVTDRIHVGIGVNNPFGLGTEWPENWIGQFITVKVDLKTFFITPTASYRITDNLSVGVGFNYVLGDVMLSRAISVPSIALPATPIVTMEMDGSGVSFNAGVLYKPMPWLSVGASYRSQTTVEAEGTAEFDPNYSSLNFPAGDVSSTLKLPATGFLGVAVTPIKDLQVEFDYQYIGWSSYDKLVIDFEANGSQSVSEKKYEDTYMLRLGAEYTMGSFAIRGGWYYDNSPVKDEYVEPLLPDANRNGYNIGFGYKITDNLSLDFSYLFIKFDDREVTHSVPEIGLNGVYSTYVDLFGINIGYTF
jgi:long-chain fatty acid transport protein